MHFTSFVKDMLLPGRIFINFCKSFCYVKSTDNGSNGCANRFLRCLQLILS